MKKEVLFFESFFSQKRMFCRIKIFLKVGFFMAIDDTRFESFRNFKFALN